MAAAPLNHGSNAPEVEISGEDAKEDTRRDGAAATVVGVEVAGGGRVQQAALGLAALWPLPPCS